jgi:hypothetical protein
MRVKVCRASRARLCRTKGGSNYAALGPKVRSHRGGKSGSPLVRKGMQPNGSEGRSLARKGAPLNGGRVLPHIARKVIAANADKVMPHVAHNFRRAESAQSYTAHCAQS